MNVVTIAKKEIIKRKFKFFRPKHHILDDVYLIAVKTKSQFLFPLKISILKHCLYSEQDKIEELERLFIKQSLSFEKVLKGENEYYHFKSKDDCEKAIKIYLIIQYELKVKKNEHNTTRDKAENL